VTELPRSIKAFDSYCTEFLDPFVAVCKKLGGDAEAIGNAVKNAWLEMRKFLLKATACKEPPQASLATHLAGVAAAMHTVSESVKRNEWEKHTKTCSEGVQCLNWLVVKPAPRDFIESYIGGSDYWANNIRREYRTSNPDQVAFCDTFKKLLQELMTYVKEFHTTGVSWNPRGIDVSEYNPDARPSSDTKVAEVSASTSTTQSNVKSSGGAALFTELSKGGEITSGLKTVTKDMQTWRKEFKAGDVPNPQPVTQKKPAAADVAKGPAKFEFQEVTSKWIVENQTSANGVVSVAVKDKKETVYIFGCVGATIEITGKCKSIVIDSCKKTTINFETAMASCEVVNSQRLQVRCRNKVASVAIDKTDGIVVHLPESSLDSTIVASKSSEMNVSFPGADGEPIERPIPEQYIHRIQGKSVTAEVSDLYSH